MAISQKALGNKFFHQNVYGDFQLEVFFTAASQTLTDSQELFIFEQKGRGAKAISHKVKMAKIIPVTPKKCHMIPLPLFSGIITPKVSKRKRQQLPRGPA